jgi:uncharacterized protein
MAVQVSYPGIYIEEFAPETPIQGVGTNVAAFIGTAASGPIEEATLVESWDQYKQLFGDISATAIRGDFMTPAVYGFFANGGSTCWIVRSSRASRAQRAMDAADPALIARAREEGPAGNNVTVTVTHDSVLGDLLQAAGQTATTLRLANPEQNITSALPTDRLEVTVQSTAPFAAGDRILLMPQTGTNQHAVVREVLSATQLRLVAPVGGTATFAGTSKVRLDDPIVGQRVLRVAVPAGLNLAQALPRGTTVRITAPNRNLVGTVESAQGTTVTLQEGLTQGLTLYPTQASDRPQLASLEFNLAIDPGTGVLVPPIEYVSMGADHPNYWRTAAVSDVVEFVEPPTPRTNADPRPPAGPYQLQGAQTEDRAAAFTDIENGMDDFLALLRPIDEVNLVCAPGVTNTGAQQAIVRHCEDLADRFAILDSPLGATTTTIRTHVAAVRSDRGYAALYFPWISVFNSRRRRAETLPPSGHIAGIYAQTDETKGVHTAPANTPIAGAVDLETRLTNEQQGRLNLDGINVLRTFPARSQPLVWGARTTTNTNRNFQYINVRRLLMFIEESLEENLQGAVFKPNNLALWQGLRRSITDFLTRVWRDGALFGATPKEAFYVRIDEALNPPSERALGRLNIEIGVHPTYPAEFIVIRIGIWRGGSDVTES